jgi:hypothetical protein
LQGVIITADPQLTPEENVEILLDTVRLLQTGLEVQTQESDALVRDFQALQQEAQVRPGYSSIPRTKYTGTYLLLTLWRLLDKQMVISSHPARAGTGCHHQGAAAGEG